jgi:hypothetical protein
MVDAELVQRAKTLLDRLAENPRFAGSAEESSARSLCRDELLAAGFDCRQRAFEFSQWPARWGPPLAAVIQVAVLVLMIRLSAAGRPGTGLVVAVGVLAVAAIAARWVRRRGVVAFPYGRGSAVNLEARRGEPSVWLVAHLDSKSQTIPMLVRIASTITLQLMSAVAFVAAGFAVFGVQPGSQAWTTLVVALIVTASPIALCFVGNRSPGAVDNASGVVAVLLAGTSALAPRDLGILITSGEELGLAGARVWAASAGTSTRILNCDTVDDEGRWRCMYSGIKPESITSAAESAGHSLGLSVRVGRLIPGILADNIPFADLDIRAVTVSRGNFSTLARIHTRRDNSTGMTGQGAARASDLLSALAKELT